MRRAARRDRNEAEIVRALEQVGASVQRLSERGVPDLLIGWRGQNLLLEIKEPLGPRTPPARTGLTDPQTDWHLAWRGQVAIVRDVAEALEAIGATRPHS